MANKVFDRVKVVTATTGQGNLTLGAAVNGFQTWAAAGAADGDVICYIIEDGYSWEIGYGQLGGGGTILNRNVISSSAAGAKLDLTGNAAVYSGLIKQDWDSKFDKSGGTITGDLTISKANPTLTLEGDATSYYPTVVFKGASFAAGTNAAIVGYGGLYHTVPANMSHQFIVANSTIATVNSNGLNVLAGKVSVGANPGAMVLNPPTATNFGFFGSDSNTGGFWFGGDALSGGTLTIGAWGDLNGIDLFANGGTRLQIRAAGITSNVPLTVNGNVTVNGIIDLYAPADQAARMTMRSPTGAFSGMNVSGNGSPGWIEWTGAAGGTYGYIGWLNGNGRFDMYGDVDYEFSSTPYVGNTKVALEGHVHTIANVTGLQAALDGKLSFTDNTVNYGPGAVAIAPAANGMAAMSAGDITKVAMATINSGTATAPTEAGISVDLANWAGGGFFGGLTANGRMGIGRYGAVTGIEFDATPYVGTNAIYHAGNKPTKGDVGLGNVDNTSDLNKPISTATQTALDGKQASGSYALTTGNVTFAGYGDFTSPGLGSTGGIRIRAQTDNSAAYVQITNNAASTQWGYWTYGPDGSANWNGTAGLKSNGNVVKLANPTIQTVASNATVTPTFANDQVNITAQAVALALANPTGTAVDGWGIAVRIKDNGTARAITFGTQYRPIGVTLPTTTVAGKTMYIGLVYNSADTKWDVVAVVQEA